MQWVRAYDQNFEAFWYQFLCLFKEQEGRCRLLPIHGTMTSGNKVNAQLMVDSILD